MLREPGQNFQPIVVRAHSAHSSEAEDWEGRLTQAFSALDLLEPFDRVAVALREVEGRVDTQEPAQ